MTKTVAKRGWSLDKFSAAVKSACERAGVRYSVTKTKDAYEAGWTVAYTVSRQDTAKQAPRVAKKAVARPASVHA